MSKMIRVLKWRRILIVRNCSTFDFASSRYFRNSSTPSLPQTLSVEVSTGHIDLSNLIPSQAIPNVTNKSYTSCLIQHSKSSHFIQTDGVGGDVKKAMWRKTLQMKVVV